LSPQIAISRPQDLYFRINVVQIKLPPLRDRKTDIPLLVASFLEKHAPPDEKLPVFSEAAMLKLMSYDWPGNVRELENAIARSIAISTTGQIDVPDLPPSLQFSSFELPPQKDEIVPIDEMERRAILRALNETNGDKVATARLLGIGKTTLYRKLKQYRVPISED